MGAPHMSTETLPSQTNTQEVVEGIRVRLEPAPILHRIAAIIIDVGIVSTVMYIALIPALIFVGAGVAFDAVTSHGDFPIASILVAVAFLVASVIGWHWYFIHFEFKTGQTYGKKLMGLKVISVDGRRLTRGQAVYREMVRWYLDGIFGIPAAIAMMSTERRQRVGDILAGTMVVYSRAREESQSFIYVKQEDFNAIRSHLELPEIPFEVRQNYLTLASHAYLSGQEEKHRAELSQWSAYFRGQLGGQAERLGLNDMTILRFFAEYCFQEDRKIKK